MHHRRLVGSTRARSTVRTLSQHEELPLLRDHLLRLDRVSRHDRFHGFINDSFIERYAEKCANDDTIVIAYFENGMVRGAAELHPPEQSPDSMPEIAFSVETPARRRGVGSFLFRQLIAEAHAKGYRKLRITTGAQNVAMRALANKFGAHLTFSQGEATGTIDVIKQDQPETASEPFGFGSTLAAARAIAAFNRAYWRMLFKMNGLGRAA
jgi:GNAT superfamily N-acetyltransferase